MLGPKVAWSSPEIIQKCYRPRALPREIQSTITRAAATRNTSNSITFRRTAVREYENQKQSGKFAAGGQAIAAMEYAHSFKKWRKVPSVEKRNSNLWKRLLARNGETAS